MQASLIFSQFAFCEHSKPPSFLQAEEQPSPSFLPSPQTVGVHTLGWPSHLKPVSNLHAVEQPSEATLLPSSHCSDEPTILSPQITSSWQGLPGGLQEKPGWVAKQLAWQPSPSLRLPSSQASSSVSLPSPQPAGTGVSGLQGEPGTVSSHSKLNPGPPAPGVLEPPLEPPF